MEPNLNISSLYNVTSVPDNVISVPVHKKGKFESDSDSSE